MFSLKQERNVALPKQKQFLMEQIAHNQHLGVKIIVSQSNKVLNKV